MTQIFLDDERDPVNSLDWIIVRDYNEFVTVITMLSVGDLNYISFDHDLGDGLTGYDCVKYLVQLDQDRNGTLITQDFDWYVHSQNPVGAANINNYLHSYAEWKYGKEYFDG